MVVRGATYERVPLDFYATPPEATRVLLDHIRFRAQVVDPCKGDGAILKVLRKAGYQAKGSDIKIGYDFLNDKWLWPGSDIVTNPPFGPGGRTAVRFIERALEVTGRRTAMLLPADFDSGKTRVRVFRDCHQFAMKIILLNRIRWFNNTPGAGNSAWYLWDRNYRSTPTLAYALQKF